LNKTPRLWVGVLVQKVRVTKVVSIGIGIDLWRWVEIMQGISVLNSTKIL